MNNKTAFIILLACIWLPSILDELELLQGWASIPITITFVTLYLLAFLTLLTSFFTEVTKDSSENNN